TADCEIRDTYCKLIDIHDKTIWYPISAGLPSLTEDIINHVTNNIVPYLAKLTSREKIISMWRQYGDAIGLLPRHRLSMAILLYKSQCKAEGDRMLKELADEYKSNEFFTTAIKKVL